MAGEQRESALLERDRERLLLLDAWRQARNGAGSLWFVVAEAGGGKTRLAEEVARAAGVQALWGAAEPISPPDPYLALRRAIPGFEPAATRAQSTARAIECLEAIGEAAPLLCVLEDLHFADEGTVGIVVRLAAACYRRPWLVVATLRPGEGGPGLRRAATELAAQGTARRLEVPALSRAAIETLVSRVRGRAVESAELDAIVSDSGGNPWLVEALARGDGGGTLVRERIALRLNTLEATTPGTRRVALAMAPAARPLPHTTVARLLGGDGPALRLALLALRDARLLNERDGAWHFEHELLRRMLLDGMMTVEREEAHRALGEALELSGGSAAELAMHFAAAADPRTVEWARRAAREADRVDAHVEALAQLERARAFAHDPATVQTILEQAAMATFRLGRWDESRQLCEEALAMRAGEPELRSILHQHAANTARLSGDLAAASAHMHAAERELEGRPPSFQMANVAVARVLQAAVAVQPEALQRATERALELAAALPDPVAAYRIRTEVQAYRAISLVDRGDPAGFDDLEYVLRAAARVPSAARDAVIAMLNVYTETVVGLFQHEAADLRERIHEGIRKHDLGWHRWSEPYHALERVQRGEFDLARTSLAIARQQTATGAAQVALSCAAVLLEARAGTPERARSLLDEMPCPDGFLATALYAVAAIEVALLEGRRGLAALARRAYELADTHCYVRLAALAALALAVAGEIPPPVPEWLAPDAPLRVFWDWAEALARDDREELRLVASRLQALELPYEAALACRHAGDLDEAYRRFQVLGATTARREAAAGLRAAAQPVPRRRKTFASFGGLTETELEICRRVAGGARNEEIAAQVGISVRTVESHLTRIYLKTAQRGRVALATWWREREARARMS